VPHVITTARVLKLAELQDRPSRILDSVISAWLGDENFPLGDAPRWSGFQGETTRLIARALPGWWHALGFTVEGGTEFALEPRPDGPVAHLLEIPDIDPCIVTRAEPGAKHLCVAMVEAIFRARLLQENLPA
jgi:hypothetical protein